MASEVPKKKTCSPAWKHRFGEWQEKGTYKIKTCFVCGFSKIKGLA